MGNNSNKLLVVYNTCGINRDNPQYYIPAIKSILDQDFKDMKVAISSCLNTEECRRQIEAEFSDSILYSYIDERRTVNVTFNKTVQEVVKKYGEFEGYLYIDSGCLFTKKDDISKLYELFGTGKYSMVTGPTDTDTAFPTIYGWHYPPHEYIVPIGKAHNCHAQIFSNDILKAFGKIIPDIFASFCTESTFPYVNAAVEKLWVISDKVLIHHDHGLDGASSSYGHGGWTHLVPECKKTIYDIITDEEGTECGFGYEECNGIKMHNPRAYVGNFAIFPTRLKDFLQNHIYLSKDELDYDKIKTTLK